MSTVNNGPQIVRSGLILDLDAGYMRSYSPNVMPNPTNIFAWSGTGNNNCTLSGDTTITRQYGSIPLKMVMTGTDPYVGSYNSPTWNLAPAASGQTWTLSFYAKASETVTGNCFIFGANSGGGYIEAPSTSFTVTTSWQRFTFTTTLGNASTAFIQMRFGGSSGQVGKTIWWDGVQLERASSATAFNPYYFGNTLWKDVSGNNNNGTFGASTAEPTYSNQNGGVIVFDGTNDFVSISSLASFNFGSAMSVFVWHKNIGGDYRGVIANTYGGGGFDLRYGREDFFGGGNNGTILNVYINTSSGTFSRSINAELNVWGNYGFTYTGSSLIAYKNGVSFSTISASGNVSVTSNSVIIGKNLVGSEFLSGNVAIVFIYNRALSASEIMQNFQATKTRFGL